MTTMFYAIVKAMTESITGLDGDALKLWDLGTYLTVSEEVTHCVNLICLAVSLCVCYVLADVVIHIIKHIKRRKTLSK
jgi:hypothetical protein